MHMIQVLTSQIYKSQVYKKIYEYIGILKHHSLDVDFILILQWRCCKK
jgi:hypothetical protein